MAENKILVANEQVSIVKVAEGLGMELPSSVDTMEKYKAYCPWGGMFHADSGMKKAFMLYPGANTAYCFAGCGHFTPVRLKAMAHDISDEDAADMLLAEIGWVGEDLDARWAAATQKEEFVQVADLAQALKVYCGRIDSQWEQRQFDQPVASRLSECLEVLDSVTTKEQATRWLAVAKRAMAITLGVGQ